LQSTAIYTTIMYMNKVSLNLTVTMTKQGRHFVAYSPALDISTSGTSEKAAHKRFAELVSIFFEEIMQAGTTTEVLSELGWKKVHKQWNPPQMSSKSIGIKLPVLV
jgi:hypothetical protein